MMEYTLCLFVSYCVYVGCRCEINGRVRERERTAEREKFQKKPKRYFWTVPFIFWMDGCGKRELIYLYEQPMQYLILFFIVVILIISGLFGLMVFVLVIYFLFPAFLTLYRNWIA
jgi:hypothetical protein